MVKSILITINEDITDSEMGQDVTVMIGANTYTGTLASIVNYLIPVQATTTVTLEGAGLKVNTP